MADRPSGRRQQRSQRRYERFRPTPPRATEAQEFIQGFIQGFTGAASSTRDDDDVAVDDVGDDGNRGRRRQEEVQEPTSTSTPSAHRDTGVQTTTTSIRRVVVEAARHRSRSPLHGSTSGTSGRRGRASQATTRSTSTTTSVQPPHRTILHGDISSRSGQPPAPHDPPVPSHHDVIVVEDLDSSDTTLLLAAPHEEGPSPSSSSSSDNDCFYPHVMAHISDSEDSDSEDDYLDHDEFVSESVPPAQFVEGLVTRLRRRYAAVPSSVRVEVEGDIDADGKTTVTYSEPVSDRVLEITVNHLVQQALLAEGKNVIVEVRPVEAGEIIIEISRRADSLSGRVDEMEEVVIEDNRGRDEGEGEGTGQQEVQTCAVCIEDLEAGETIRRLPCSHLGHRACLVAWFWRHNRTCPICRADVLEGLDWIDLD